MWSRRVGIDEAVRLTGEDIQLPRSIEKLASLCQSTLFHNPTTVLITDCNMVLSQNAMNHFSLYILRMMFRLDSTSSGRYSSKTESYQ
jgi:hypothetical protein